MAFDAFGDTVPIIGGNSYVPVPERNPAFHDVGFSAPVTGSIYGGGVVSDPVGDVFSAVSSGIRGVGGLFTSGLNTAADIARSYNNYEAATNPRPAGIDMQQLLVIGGGVLLLALVLK